MLRLATDTPQRRCCIHVDYGLKKRSIWRLFGVLIQTLEALVAWTLTLSEKAHTNPSNKTSHTRVRALQT